MDVSTWIALAALVVSAGNPAINSALRNAGHDAKVDQILENLTSISGDHEDRLREHDGRLRKGRL